MSQIDNAFETTMEKLWENKKYNTLRDVLVTMQPAQVAALFAMMPDNAPAPLFRLLPKEQAAETFVEMEPDMQEKLIRSFSDTELKSVLDELYVDVCWLRPFFFFFFLFMIFCAIPRKAPAPS